MKWHDSSIDLEMSTWMFTLSSRWEIVSSPAPLSAANLNPWSACDCRSIQLMFLDVSPLPDSWLMLYNSAVTQAELWVNMWWRVRDRERACQRARFIEKFKRRPATPQRAATGLVLCVAAACAGAGRALLSADRGDVEAAYIIELLSSSFTALLRPVEMRQ